MVPIRVAMTGLPRMMEDLLRSVLAREHDIEVTSGPVGDDLTDQVGVTGAHIVVSGEESTSHEELEALFVKHPKLMLVVISQDGRDISRFQLHGARDALGEVSPDELLDVIRDVREHRLFGADG